MSHRQSNRPDRRIVPPNTLTQDELKDIEARARYGGIAYHKLHPGDYGFNPPTSPRPSKSVCDDLRPVLKKDAARLLREGIRKGMVSRPNLGQLPKYIWAVDGNGEVYEAKTDTERADPYHGYRLGDSERRMRAEVLSEWKKR